MPLTPPGAEADEAASETWLALTTAPLPVAEVYEWSVRPDCGAVVLFSGTVRDHAEGRDGVAHLTYEAYEEQVVPRLGAIAAEIRAPLADDRAHRAAAPHRPPRAGRRRR